MMFTLRSPAFEHGRAVPRRFTCDGDNVSPPLEWTGAPAGTVRFALVLDDPDAPSGTFTHWLVCDLPAEQTRIDEGIPLDGIAMEGVNDFGREGYGGPCPPRGHGPHHYRFHLYAVGQAMKLPNGFSRRDLDRALRGHVLGTALLEGTYGRSR